MRELRTACLVILLLNITCVLCRPLEKDKEHGKTPELVPVPSNEQPTNATNHGVKTDNGQLDNKYIEDATGLTDFDQTNSIFEEDDKSTKEQRPSFSNEEDEENEKFCEELCYSCLGSQHVFDVAEPSCFCKVDSVPSVKCLEDKVTDEIYMRVIAYVETNPINENEQMAARYLKEREELSLNRYRRDSKSKRCCGNLAETNPRPSGRNEVERSERDQESGYERSQVEETDNKEDERNSQAPRMGKSKEGKSSKQRNKQSARQSRKQKLNEENDENKVERTTSNEVNQNDESLGARKITAHPELENLWRKALRAEDTSPERTEEETEENVEKQKLIKLQKEQPFRRTYKYQPSSDVMSLLNQKQVKATEKEVENNSERSKKDKPNLKSNQQEKTMLGIELEKTEDLLTDESSQKKKRPPSKRKKAYTKQPSAENENESIKAENDANKKLATDIVGNTQTTKPTIKRYKSLDDMIYDQELKRLKFLSSIQEKYGYIPEPTRLEELKSDKDEERATKTLTKKKKLMENNTNILGSKDTKHSKTSSEEAFFKIKDEGHRIESKSDTDLGSKENRKYRINKTLKEKVPQNLSKQNQGTGNFLRALKENLKPVSPSIPLEKSIVVKESKSQKHGYGAVEKKSSEETPYFQNFTPEYVETIVQLRSKNEKKSKVSSPKTTPLNEKASRSTNMYKESDEQILETPSKYLKAKYSGVKPSLIRDDGEPLAKKSLSLRNESGKDMQHLRSDTQGENEDLRKNQTEQPKRKKSLRSRYHQKDTSKTEPFLGESNSKTEPFLREPNSKIEPAKARSMELNSLLNNEEDKKMKNKLRRNKTENVEFSDNEKLKATLEEQRHTFEDRLRETFEKIKTHPLKDERKIKYLSERENSDIKLPVAEQHSQYLGSSNEPCVDDTSESIAIEDENRKPASRERIEQRKASRLGSSPTKFNEPQTFQNERLSSTKDHPWKSSLKDGERQKIIGINNYEGETMPVFGSPLDKNPQIQEQPTKLSLKELIEQKKEERQKLLEKSREENKIKDSPVVGASLDQNPQKHCEQCMEYMNRIEQLQKEQKLGQKPFNTRSIPSPSDRRATNTLETEGEVTKEKNSNCKCSKQLIGFQNELLGQVNPSNTDAMLSQPFNTGDVIKTFENIKSGIESSIQGGNDKISKGFNDLKVNIQNQYEHATHSDLAESIKKTTDKVSKNLSNLHIKDAVTKELSDIGHGVENTLESITNKGIEGNLKEVSKTLSNVGDKMTSEFHHLTNGTVSQPASRRYLYNPQQVKANYAAPSISNQQLYTQGQTSGNAAAPVNLM